MKQLISLLLCLALVLTLATPALASEDAGTGGDGQSQSEGSQDNGSSDGSSTGDSSGSGDSGSDGAGSGETGSSGETQGHTHTQVTVTIPSTCSEEGGTVVMCSICEEVFSVALTAKLPHTYDNACDPDCNVCKTTRETAHTFSTQWSKSSTKHWHACTVCGAQADLSDHYPGPAATEDKDQFCLTCGLLMMRRKGHTHSYAATWTSDETSHWYACTSCGEKKDMAEHTYDSPCDPDCNLCGFQRSTAHSLEGDYLSDETGHWMVCSLCQKASTAEPHIPGTPASDTEASLCSVCGYELKEALVHVHAFSQDWTSDADSHWKACACGEISNSAAHNWKDGTEEAGLITYLCQDCGAEKAEAAEEESTFPWLILLVAALAAALGCIVALIFLLRPKKRRR